MTALLEVKDLRVSYASGQSLTKAEGSFQALKGINLALEQGQTLGIVGESGCGKSTLAKTIVRLLEPSSGRIIFDGVDIATLRGPKLKPYRKQIQMIFQDPSDSLNPKHTLFSIIAEPMEIHHEPDREERVNELMDLVGLPKALLTRYPHELSGGQRQRVGIARALALKPRLVICDEPVSALDLSVQSQIINLLLGLQKTLGLSYIFISHDLRLVRHFSDWIAVMYKGEIVEYGASDTLYHAPKHEYTRSLLKNLS
jgi:peptide/nickel transport system ATP-binding protein